MIKNSSTLKFFTLCWLFFLFSCLESNSVNSVIEEDVIAGEVEREVVLKELYEEIKKEYYWYDAIKEISYTSAKYYDTSIIPYNASAAREYFNDIKYDKDKWSYVGPLVFSISSSSGVLYGFNYNTKEENDSLFLRIVYVIPDSPIDRAGMKRGDRIMSFQATATSKTNLNDQIINTTLTNNLPLYREEIFYSTSGNFVLQDANGITKSISSGREELEPHYFLNINQGETNKINKRFAPTLITLTNRGNTLTKNIGYTIYTGFDDKSVVDLLNMFNFWQQNKVKDVIFDLRYNGGGRVDVTQFIVSMLINNFGKTFTTLDHRDVSSSSDRTYLIEKIDSNFLNENFQITTNDYPASNIVNLAIESAYFLVTKDSASASELLIKALEPYIDVTVVGENTHGKGYGQSGGGISFKGGYYKSIINFKYFNANKEGVDFNGIPPTSGFEGSDDISENWGVGETLFDLAINDLQLKLEQERVTASGRSFDILDREKDSTYYSFSVDAPEEDIEIPYERNWQ